MGLSRFIEERDVAPNIPTRGLPATATEAFQANAEFFYTNHLSVSKQLLTNEAMFQRRRDAEKILGAEVKASDSPFFNSQALKNVANQNTNRQYNELITKHQDEAIDNMIDNDDRFRGLRKTQQIFDSAIERAQEATKNHLEVSNRTQGLTHIPAFTGAVVASFADPVNVLAMAAGFGAVRGVFRAAAVEAALNIVAETAIQPAVIGWQKELQQDYGLDDAAFAVLVAGGAGGLFGGLGAKLRGDVPGQSGVDVFNTAADSMSRKDRISAIFMRDVSVVKESNVINDLARHSDQIKQAETAFRENRAFKSNISLGEFLKAVGETTPSVRVAREKFAEFAKGMFDIGSLPNGLLAKVPKKGQLAASVFTPEELVMLEIAGFKANKAGQISRKALADEADKRIKAGVKLPKDDSHVQQFRALLGEKPKYQPESLPHQLIKRGAKKQGTIRVREFSPEELEMLESAGFTRTSSGRFLAKDFQDELARREAAGLLYPELDPGQHIVEHNNAKAKNQRRVEDLFFDDRQIPEKEVRESFGMEDPIPLDQHTNEVKRLKVDNQELIAGLKDLEARVGDRKILIDDEAVSVSELVARAEGDNNYLASISKCGVA